MTQIHAVFNRGRDLIDAEEHAPQAASSVMVEKGAQSALLSDSAVYSVRYRSVGHALVRIIHDEGFFALYRGIVPRLLIYMSQVSEERRAK